ncbi:MAG: hypothetical protein IK092_03815 [Muribaculaceae bacterium]|nr:hypothetical protein [Muribaculaceae bacterium]
MKHFLLPLVALVPFFAQATHITLDDTIESQVFYKGCVYTYKITVPAEYNGLKPACLYVGLDGILCHAPEVIDTLITTGEMPVTIGVFLQPGLIKDGNGRVIRYNRSNEFDKPTPTFVTFLEKELLPRVEGTVTPDGRRIKLSHNGADRMIFGLSSGGIAAFTAAWHRPDMFGRVFSGVGTFVAMRGGNDWQAIVRKHEPKPLKIFLQDGSNDAWNPLFGHWYEGNQMLASALDFAGYDAKYDWSDGGHNVNRATAIFSQVMRWMWSDWGKPIEPGETQNDFLSETLVKGSKWTIFNDEIKFSPMTEPTFYPDSSLVATRVKGDNCLWQFILDSNGELQSGEPFYWLHNYDNALLRIGDKTFDSNGNLWVATSAGLQVCDQNGRVRGIFDMPDTYNMPLHLIVSEGQIVLVYNYGAWSRKFNVKPAIPGVTPKSQGQG